VFKTSDCVAVDVAAKVPTPVKTIPPIPNIARIFQFVLFIFIFLIDKSLLSRKVSSWKRWHYNTLP
jgi:hypothetical protein